MMEPSEPTLETASNRRTTSSFGDFIRAAGTHLFDWAEFYIWVPIALLSIIGAAEFEYFLNGHRPEEGVGWIGDYASRATAIVLVIVACSVYKQATGTWMTKDDKMAHPFLAMVGSALTLGSAILFAYILLH